MINTVYEILTSIDNPVPVLWNNRPEITVANPTVIAYYFFNEGNLIYGDGEGFEPIGSVQVSVFSTGDYTNTVTQVKQKMKEAGFRYVDGWDSEDSLPEKYYQKILIFNYLESEVIRDGI